MLLCLQDFKPEVGCIYEYIPDRKIAGNTSLLETIQRHPEIKQVLVKVTGGPKRMSKFNDMLYYDIEPCSSQFCQSVTGGYSEAWDYELLPFIPLVKPPRFRIV